MTTAAIAHDAFTSGGVDCLELKNCVRLKVRT